MGDDDIVSPITATSLAQARAVDLSAVGAVCLLVYDIFLTMDREVTLVWRASWTGPKCLYLLARYFGVISQLINLTQSTSSLLSTAFCQHFQYFSGAACQVLVAIVQVILVIRVRAFYMHNAFIRASLVFLLAAELITQLVILAMTLSEIIAITTPRESAASGCITGYVPHYWTEYWMPCLIFDTILFALALARVWKVSRRGWSAPSLHVLVFSDGVVFFALIFAGLLANMLLLFTMRGALAQIGIAWLLAFFAIAGARIHLNQQETRRALARTPRPRKAIDLGFDILPPPVCAAAPGAAAQTTLGADTSLEFASRVSVPPARHFDAGDAYVTVARVQPDVR